MDKAMLDLYYKDICIGQIQCTGADFPWNHGIFIPNSNADITKEFLNYFVGGNNDIESKFSAEYFTPGNWYVIFVDKNLKWEIQIPRIHPGNLIGWGWL